MSAATKPPSRHLSSLEIDRLLAGGAAGAGEHLADCPDCRALLAGARAQCDAFRAELLPRTLPRIRGRLERRRRANVMGIGFGVLATAATALAVVPGVLRPGAAPVDAVVSIKGGPTLRVVARRGEHVFPVTPGMGLQQGDRIRFVVEPAGYGYLLIASVDGAGKATVFHPWNGATSAPLAPTARLEVPGSIELDAARGPERLFAIFSRRPVAAPGLTARLTDIGLRGHDAIRAGSQLAGPDQVQLTLLIEKVTP